MNNSITLILPGKPIPTRRIDQGKYSRYNSQTDLMNQAKILILNQLPDGFEIIEKNIPVIANISFFFCPAKAQKTKKFLALIKDNDYPYLKTVDIDNLGKFILDSCNKLIWYDDAQVYDGRLSKYYSLNSRTEIEILW